MTEFYISHKKWHVALLAEGVDRNDSYGEYVYYIGTVALLAEGVDRNFNITR